MIGVDLPIHQKFVQQLKKLNAHVGISFDGDVTELSCVMKMVK